MTRRTRLSLPLEQVRIMLFPNLPAEEGRAHVEAAIAGAADIETWKRIEEIAAVEPDLMDNLMWALKELADEPDEPQADKPGT